MKTKTEITLDIKRVADLIGKPPSYRDYRKHGQFSSSTIVNKFGKWDKAIIEAFGEPYRKPKKAPKMNECQNPNCKALTQWDKFCSRSCAATINNHKNPKRKKKIHLCPVCSKPISKKAKRCGQCKMMLGVKEYGERKLSEFTSTFARHKYQKVRHHAHRIAKIHNLKKKCKVCGYDLHADLCHKKPIHEFHKNTKIKIINDISNLVYLCKNHHWELDNKHLSL